VLEAELAESKTDPTPVGQGHQYLLRHFKALTLFLRKAGTPLLEEGRLHRKECLILSDAERGRRWVTGS